MLQHLSVENFILIRRLEIDFSEGLTVITGETGAGKSILVGALGLILGQRADVNVLQDKQKKCVVEGVFRVENYDLEQFFIDHDIDFEPVAILRREINPQGKSRAFINDTPVNVSALKELGDRLVDIHSQHQTLELNEASFQLSMVDSYAGNAPLLREYRQKFDAYTALCSEITGLQEKEQQAAGERDYHQFLFEELEKAALRAGEQTEMEEELQVLTHAEDIKTRLYQALNLLSQSDRNILGMLAEARQQLGYVAGYRKELDQMTARLEECRIELKDVNSGIEQLADNTLYDEGRIETINQRLALIYHLEQKHRVDSVEELIHIMQGLSDQLVHHDTLQGRIEVLLAGKAELENELLRRAGVLSGNRSKAILLIEKEIQTLLGALGMPSALFQIRQVPKETPGRSGMDQVTLLFTANRGTELQPVTRVASGGELSRLMLAIKSMVINRNMLPTILFDEIDSGVSGDIAGKVGTIMKKMASNIQVLAISHLPQIAGKAHHHFLAYKEFLKGETVSNLRELTNDERIEEVARIMSNDTVTDTARAAARELIEEIEVNGT